MATKKVSPTKLVQRARAQMAKSRMKEKAQIQTAIGKGSGIVTAAGIGAFEDKIPVTFLKIPTKLWIASAAYLTSAFTKGAMSKAFESIGDASASIYTYKVAMQSRMKTEKAFVAGDENNSDETGYVEEQ